MDDITSMAEALGHRLQALGAFVATAESCTGGGIAEAITRVAGSSAWFEAGFVTYSNRQKHLQLQVPEAVISEHGAVSAPVVEAMAKGASCKGEARFAVAVSGVAGPGGGSEAKPVGTVWLAWTDGEQVFTQRNQFAGDRHEVRRQTIVAALRGLLALTSGEKPGRG